MSENIESIRALLAAKLRAPVESFEGISTGAMIEAVYQAGRSAGRDIAEAEYESEMITFDK